MTFFQICSPNFCTGHCRRCVQSIPFIHSLVSVHLYVPTMIPYTWIYYRNLSSWHGVLVDYQSYLVFLCIRIFYQFVFNVYLCNHKLVWPNNMFYNVYIGSLTTYSNVWSWSVIRHKYFTCSNLRVFVLKSVKIMPLIFFCNYVCQLFSGRSAVLKLFLGYVAFKSS